MLTSVHQSNRLEGGMAVIISVVILVGLDNRRTYAQETEPLPAQARRVLKAHCHRCHNGPGSSSGYDFDILQHESLVASPGEKWVVGHSLKESPLWDAVQKRMPKPQSPERHGFGDAQRTVIKKWIEAGAPAFPSVSRRPFISLKQMLTAIHGDLSSNGMSQAERLNTRYFSLVHIHNNTHFDDEDIRYQRAALSKVINSLSWMSTITLPRSVPIDQEDGILFAVDIRKLGWDQNQSRPWKIISESYPYGVKYANIDQEMARSDAQIESMSGTHQVWVRSDWFVVTATRPGLYHTLLELPKNAIALEQKLEVNVIGNITNGKVSRAGFAKSGVSGQNRLVERHATKYGAYWKSYDFRQDNARANIARFPLGPHFSNHPFAEHAFKHDGGELIFNLPNGLQAYLLVDGNDNRIDAGPVDVVSDDKKVSGTPIILNGVSCMACHRHGMIRIQDSLRDSNVLFGKPREQVASLHPEQRVLDQIVIGDEARFLKALESATGTFIRTGGNIDPKILQFKEPVTEVVTGYQRHLDVEDIVSELYLSGLKGLQEMGKERRRTLALESVIEQKGVLPRYQWDAADADGSLMQKAAEAFFYTPLVR